MSKKNTLHSILALSLTLIVLSGCGVDSENITKEIVEKIENKDYFTANEVFEEATKELSEGKQEKLSSVVSEGVKDYLNNSFKEMKSDSSKEASFYNSLNGITNIGIKDKSLDEKIESYRQERAEEVEIHLEKDTDDEVDAVSDEENSNNNSVESNSGNGGQSPYTEKELEADPKAPSKNTEDYNVDGEYVPEDGPTENPADYNSNGEYKPADQMTQEEIEAELEKMLGE